MLKLEDIQNSDENEIRSTSFYQKKRQVTIDDYEIVDYEYTNINNQSFI